MASESITTWHASDHWLASCQSYRSGKLILTYFSGEPLAAYTNGRRLTMVDLFCCTGAIARQVPEAGSEVLSRVIASGCAVLTWVLVAGDEVRLRKCRRVDSGSDSLLARVVTALAHLLSSGVQLPITGYAPLCTNIWRQVLLTQGKSLKRQVATPATQADASGCPSARHVALGHYVLLYPEDSLSVLHVFRPMITRWMACS